MTEEPKYTKEDMQAAALRAYLKYSEDINTAIKYVTKKERRSKYKVVFLFVTMVTFAPQVEQWWAALLIGITLAYFTYLMDYTLDAMFEAYIRSKIRKIFKSKMKGKENDDSRTDSEPGTGTGSKEEGTKGS